MSGTDPTFTNTYDDDRRFWGEAWEGPDDDPDRYLWIYWLCGVALVVALVLGWLRVLPDPDDRLTESEPTPTVEGGAFEGLGVRP